jgi:hypothetical protein
MPKPTLSDTLTPDEMALIIRGVRWFDQRSLLTAMPKAVVAAIWRTPAPPAGSGLTVAHRVLAKYLRRG